MTTYLKANLLCVNVVDTYIIVKPISQNIFEQTDCLLSGCGSCRRFWIQIQLKAPWSIIPSKLVMAKFQRTVIGKNSSSCSSKRFSFQVLLDRLLRTLASCPWISEDGGCCTSCLKNELFLAKQFSGAIVNYLKDSFETKGIKNVSIVTILYIKHYF